MSFEASIPAAFSVTVTAVCDCRWIPALPFLLPGAIPIAELDRWLRDQHAAANSSFAKSTPRCASPGAEPRLSTGQMECL